MADIKISQLAFVSDPSPSGLVEVSVPTPSGYVSRSTFKHSPFDFPVITDTVSKTAQFTAELGKRHLIDTSGGGFTADLPTVASPGLISFLIETTSNNQLTISPSGVDKVGGKNQFKIRSGATTIESDGIEWHIIQRTGRNPNRIDPPEITTDLDPFDNADWDSAATEVYLSASGVRTIQGFEESTFIDMDNVLVVNDGSSNIIIAHDNATTASNSVLIQGGANYTLPPNGAIRITRDGTVNKWRLASTSSVGGGEGVETSSFGNWRNIDVRNIISSQSEVDFLNIDDSYDEYRIIANSVKASTSTTLNLRLGSGSFDTGNNYSSAYSGRASDGTIPGNSHISVDNIFGVLSLYADVDETNIGEITLPNLRQSTDFKYVRFVTDGKGTSDVAHVDGAGVWKSTAVVDRIRLYSQAGTIDSGRLTLQGRKTSVVGEQLNSEDWVTSLSGHLLPTASGTQSIGSPSFPVKDIYIEPSSLYIGDTSLQNDNGNLKFGPNRVRTEADSGVYRTFMQDYQQNTFALVTRHTFNGTGGWIAADNNSGNDSKVTVTVPSPDSIIEMEFSIGSHNLSSTAIVQFGFKVDGTDEGATFSQNATPWSPLSYKKTVTGYSGTFDIYPIVQETQSQNAYIENNYFNCLTVKVYDPNPMEAAPTVQGPYDFVASKDVTSLQSSIDLPGIFTDEYIGYKIIAYDIQGGGENVLGLRFETGGSFDSGTNYKSHRSSTNDTSSSYSAGSGTTAYIQCGLASTAATSKGVFEMIITNPTSTSLYTEAVGSTVNTNYSGNVHGGSFVGVHLNAAAVTGIQLIVPSTTILGKVVVWGIKKNFEEKEFLPIGMDFQESTPLVASFTTQSTSLVDSGLSVTITPSSATSKILLIPKGTFSDGSSSAQNKVHYQFYRDGSPIGQEARFGTQVGGGGNQLFWNTCMPMVDSPNTTSPVTYSLYISTDNAADYAIAETDAYLQAVEIPGQVVTGVTKLQGDIEHIQIGFVNTIPTATGTLSTSTANLFRFDTGNVTSNSGITYDDTNRRFLLKAGKTYELDAFMEFSGSAAGYMNFRWHNGTSFIGNDAQPLTVSGSWNENQNPNARAVIKPSVDTYVYLQLEANSNINNVTTTGSYVLIKQIDGHIGQSLREEYRASGVSGYGSTNTAIYYFTTEDKNALSSLASVVNDSTNGFELTALEDCEISISTYIYSSGVSYVPAGISLNSNQLTTDISGITASHRMAVNHAAGTNGASANASATFLLNAGDVVRTHGGVGTAQNGNGGVKILLRK